MTSFLDDWRKFYGALAPLSYALPKDHRWVRFHALPDGKRCPETDDERATVLQRANAIARDVLGVDQCWLAQLGDIELGWEANANRWRDELQLRPEGAVLYDGMTWPVFARQIAFEPTKYDGLLEDIASDQAFRTLWLRSADGRVFAPYDGGFDIFLESQTAAQDLRAKHQAWLSWRADGL